MGRETRVRRYTTSRGFWGETHERQPPERTRDIDPPTYAERVETCARTCHIFATYEHVDPDTGEVFERAKWLGTYDLDWNTAAALDDGQDDRRMMRDLDAATLAEALARLRHVAGRDVQRLDARRAA